MGNNLIGKCFWVSGQLIKVIDEYSAYPTYENYYRHEAITKMPNSYGIGYALSSGVHYLGKDIKQADSTIWDKTLKLMKLGNSACVVMLANASANPVYTGYKKLVYTYPNIVKVLSNNRTLLITPDHFSIRYNYDIDRYLFLRNQVVAVTSTTNISKDIYDKVYKNIVDTCNRIQDLWT